jgi:hypothetical protein
MPKADCVHSTPRTIASEFLVTVNRLQISLMIRDPFVAAAFRKTEDDGPAPCFVSRSTGRARSTVVPLSHCYFTGGDGDDALRVAKASALPIDRD